MLNRRSLLAGGVALSLVRPANAEGPSPAELEANRKFFTEGLYLPLLQTLLGRGSALDRPNLSRLAQMQATLGQEAKAFRTYAEAGADTHRGFDVEAWRERLRHASAEDALTAIAKAAKGRRIVILNEAHHVSRCRAFALEVARVLRREGFTDFAAEAFTSPSGAPPRLSLSPLTSNAGIYLLDPVFAQLVREVRDSWSGCFSYEAPGGVLQSISDPHEQIAKREDLESDALAEILKGAPEMRLFIYCGYGHLAKVPMGEDRWMAARLWEKTGIEPLSITQAFGTPAPDPAFSPQGVEEVLQTFHPKTSIVLRDAAGAVTTSKVHGDCDLAIYHPRVLDRDGRPGWLAAHRIRHRVSVPPGSGLKLIQAIPTGERAMASNTIPTDQVLVDDDRRSVDLWLPPGLYDIGMETEAGRSVLTSGVAA